MVQLNDKQDNHLRPHVKSGATLISNQMRLNRLNSGDHNFGFSTDLNSICHPVTANSSDESTDGWKWKLRKINNLWSITAEYFIQGHIEIILFRS